MPHKNIEDRRAYDRARSRKRRASLVEGKVCERCGFDNPCALEFHHRDPNDKFDTVGRMMMRGEAALMAEVAKCELICANCHAIEHYSEVV